MKTIRFFSAAIFAAFTVSTCVCSQAWSQQSPAMDRAMREMGRGDYDGAIVSFGETIGFDMNNKQAYMKRGQCFYKLGNYPQAITDFSHLIDMNGNDSDAYLWRGTCDAKTEDHEAAVRDYLKAIRLNPELARRYKNGMQDGDAGGDGDTRHGEVVKGNFGREPVIQGVENSPRLGRPENKGAVRDYEKAMALYLAQKNTDELPEQAPGDQPRPARFARRDNGGDDGGGVRGMRNGRGRGTTMVLEDDDDLPRQAQKSQIRDRIAKLNNAIEADSSNTRLLYRRGLLYERLENYDQAIADLSKAIGLNPMSGGFYLARARIYHHLHQPDLEQADIQKAQSVDPSIPAKVRFVDGATTPERQNRQFKDPIE